MIANAKIKAVLMAFYRPLSDVSMFEKLTEENENYESKTNSNINRLIHATILHQF
jgi:hypothetical protein